MPYITGGYKMELSRGEDPKASYEVNSIGLLAGPIHKKLLAYYNDIHAARACGNTEEATKLKSLALPLLEQFELTECKSTPNPAWLLAKMHAGFYVAKGDFETALKFECEGYKHANEEPQTNDRAKDQRKSVSASNIADELWRVGRAKEGLDWAFLSVQLWETNSINHLVLAITAFHAGLKDQAEAILSKLFDLADFDNEHDALAACIAYEGELVHMKELKSVQKLLTQIGVN
jgi:hypothetical protein